MVNKGVGGLSLSNLSSRSSAIFVSLMIGLVGGCGGSGGSGNGNGEATSSGGEALTSDSDTSETVPTQTCQGVEFAETVEVAGRTLQLNGLGLREARIFEIDVYVGAFYVENRVTTRDEAVMTEQVKQLRLHMVRDVEASDAVNAWDEGFRFNSGPERLALEERILRLNDMMSNFYEGDELVFTYVPEDGVIVSVNGVERGRIQGADFAQGLMRVWFGHAPADEDLQAGMLGGDCD